MLGEVVGQALSADLGETKRQPDKQERLAFKTEWQPLALGEVLGSWGVDNSSAFLSAARRDRCRLGGGSIGSSVTLPRAERPPVSWLSHRVPLLSPSFLLSILSPSFAPFPLLFKHSPLLEQKTPKPLLPLRSLQPQTSERNKKLGNRQRNKEVQGDLCQRFTRWATQHNLAISRCHRFPLAHHPFY